MHSRPHAQREPPATCDVHHRRGRHRRARDLCRPPPADRAAAHRGQVGAAPPVTDPIPSQDDPGTRDPGSRQLADKSGRQASSPRNSSPDARFRLAHRPNETCRAGVSTGDQPSNILRGRLAVTMIWHFGETLGLDASFSDRLLIRRTGVPYSYLELLLRAVGSAMTCKGQSFASQG